MEEQAFAEALATHAEKLGLSLPNEACGRLHPFLQLIKNAPPGLVGFSPASLFREVVLDTLCLLPHLPEGSLTLLDIGTGAGIPGVPLLCLRPDLRLTLLDSRARRINFARQALQKLGLKARCVNTRAETFGRGEGRGLFDIVLARGVKPLPVVIEYALPTLKIAGCFYAQQGESFEEPAAHALHLLGGRLTATIPYALEPEHRRHLLLFKKTAPTHKRYPRRPGIPEKRPLGCSVPSPRIPSCRG